MSNTKRTEKPQWTIQEINNHEWPPDGPQPPWTVAEAARMWNRDTSRVKQYIKEGRVPVLEKGGGEQRSGLLLILSPVMPDGINQYKK